MAESAPLAEVVAHERSSGAPRHVFEPRSIRAFASLFRSAASEAITPSEAARGFGHHPFRAPIPTQNLPRAYPPADLVPLLLLRGASPNRGATLGAGGFWRANPLIVAAFTTSLRRLREMHLRF